MTTAIISALPEEQAGLQELLQSAQRVQAAGRTFWRGELQGQPVVLALSGIGKVAAATTATALIERMGVQRLLFTGVAGGLAQQVRVGDVVIGTEYLQHDMNASPIFPQYEVPLYARSRFAASAELVATVSIAACAVFTPARSLGGRRFRGQTVENRVAFGDTDEPIAVAIGAGGIDKRYRFLGGLNRNPSAAQTPSAQFGVTNVVHQGLIVSGDRFVSTTAESLALQAALPDALCVEMEGAAVAQVCFDYALPFVAVRSISDRADDAAHRDFPEFLRTVAAPLSRALICKTMELL
jgi:adenosylhomocysteine nucleosidase